MKLTTIIFGATAIVCAILMVLMMLSINNTEPNNPYRQGIPCHEMDMSFFSKHIAEKSYALPAKVFLDKDYYYYSMPGENSTITYHVESSNEYFDPIHKWGSGFETYPTYVRGWRYAVIPILAKEELDNSQYYTKNNLLYIKPADLVELVFADIDMRTKGQSLMVRTRIKFDLIQNGLFKNDQVLFKNGLYLSPDLPLYRVLHVLMIFSGSGLALCLAVMFIRRVCRCWSDNTCDTQLNEGTQDR